MLLLLLLLLMVVVVMTMVLMLKVKVPGQVQVKKAHEQEVYQAAVEAWGLVLPTEVAKGPVAREVVEVAVGRVMLMVMVGAEVVVAQVKAVVKVMVHLVALVWVGLRLKLELVLVACQSPEVGKEHMAGMGCWVRRAGVLVVAGVLGWGSGVARTAV
jgi:hypothetical protein